MKNIGIYLAYGPDQQLTGEGLGRLLGFLLSGLIQKKDYKITIACPYWGKKEVIKLFEDMKIDEKNVSFLTTNGIPFWVRLYRYKNGHSQEEGRVFTIIKTFFDKGFLFVHKIIIEILTTRSVFFALSLMLLVMMLLFVLSPLLLLSVVAFGLFVKLLPSLKRVMKAIFRISKRFFRLNDDYFLYDEFRKRELKKLADIINKEEEIRVWLSPTVMWPEIRFVKKNVVTVVPDIVFFDFPAMFVHYYGGIKRIKRNMSNILETLKSSSHFITYSNYVKEYHLMQHLNIKECDISVIPHGFISNLDFFEEDNYKEKSNVYLKEYFNETRKKYFKLFKDNKGNKNIYRIQLKNYEYISSYGIDSCKYLFYPTQNRPNKNLSSLIKAMAIVVHKYKKDIKLILTASIDSLMGLYDLIEEQNLQYHILFFERVPSKVLAALNAKAICSVNTTIFEGGFPFSFSEAYSVGTPSLLSKIPLVEEIVTEKSLAQFMLFDPYDPEDIAMKIVWAIDNAEQLYEMENVIYQKLASRTWKDVADDYFRVLENYS